MINTFCDGNKTKTALPIHKCIEVFYKDVEDSSENKHVRGGFQKK